MMVVRSSSQTKKIKKRKKKGQYERYILSIKYFITINQQYLYQSDLKVASKARQIVKTISEVDVGSANAANIKC